MVAIFAQECSFSKRAGKLNDEAQKKPRHRGSGRWRGRVDRREVILRLYGRKLHDQKDGVTVHAGFQAARPGEHEPLGLLGLLAIEELAA